MTQYSPNKELYKKLFASLTVDTITFKEVKHNTDKFELKFMVEWLLETALTVRVFYNYSPYINGRESFYPESIAVSDSHSLIQFGSPTGDQMLTDEFNAEMRKVFDAMDKPLTVEQRFEKAILAHLESVK